MPTSTSLQDLHDIVVPTTISWLPPAPGWYALGVTVLLFLLWGAIVGYRRWLRNGYRREALAELARIENDLAGGKDIHRLLPRLPELLKRTAIAAYGRGEVASLYGDSWLEFLDRSIGRAIFSGNNGRLLLSCSYDSATRLHGFSQAEIRDLCRSVSTWLSGHHGISGQKTVETDSFKTEGRG